MSVFQIFCIDGCAPEATCNPGQVEDAELLCVDWPESDISGSQYTLPCPCGNLNDSSIYNRNVTRRCTGDFDSRAAWEPANFEDCSYTDRVLQLCRLLNSVSFHNNYCKYTLNSYAFSCRETWRRWQMN